MYGELMRLGAFVAQSIKWWGCGLASKRIGFDFWPFIHSFIPLACAECNDSLPFSGASSIPLCYVLFPFTLLQQLFFHPLSPHLAIYFLIYLSILLFPNSYIIPFWELCFLPFYVRWFLAMQEIFVLCTVPLPSVVSSPPVARDCKAARMWSWPLPLSVATIKNAFTYTATSPCIIIVWCLIGHLRNCTLYGFVLLVYFLFYCFFR